MACHFKNTILAAFLLWLTACSVTNVSTVDGIRTNRNLYLNNYFSAKNVSADVLAKLPFKNVGLDKFKMIKVDVDSLYHSKIRDVERGVQQEFTRTKDGLTQEIRVLSFQQKPYLLYFKLSYAGLISLRSQVALYRKQIPESAQLTIKINKISGDVFALKNNDLFTASWQKRIENDQKKLINRSTSCRAGSQFPAARVSANLKGDAQYIACKDYVDSRLLYKSRYVLLKQYRLAILVGQSSAISNLIDKIIHVSVE